MDKYREKLYACITNEKFDVILRTRIEVDEAIKDEEELHGDMSYSVVGPVKVPEILHGGKRAFVLIWTDKINIFKDVMTGNNIDEVTNRFFERKGIKEGESNRISPLRIIDFTDKVKEYYE